MKQILLLSCCCLLLGSQSVTAQNHKISAEATYSSRSIWRGFDDAAPRNNAPGMEVTATWARGDSGPWLEILSNTILTHRDEIDYPSELDVTIGWTESIVKMVDINFGYTQYSFPVPNDGKYFDYHIEELFAGIEVHHTLINPYAQLSRVFGSLEGFYLLGGLGIPLGRSFLLPLMLDVSLGLQNYEDIDDPGMSDLNFGLTTELGNDNVMLYPGIHWTITGSKEINTHNEFWVSLGLGLSN